MFYQSERQSETVQIALPLRARLHRNETPAAGPDQLALAQGAGTVRLFNGGVDIWAQAAASVLGPSHLAGS